jgi:hypothetical protein
VSDPSITCRPAFPDEYARAASLCKPSPAMPGDGQTRCFLAIKSRPVERIVGAVFWRDRIDSKGSAPIVIFEWAMVAALEDSPEEIALLKSLATTVAEALPDVSRIRTSSWLDPQCPAVETLAEAGFSGAATRELSAANVPAWRKLLEASPRSELQPLPLAPEHFGKVGELIAGKGISDTELAYGFETAGGEHPVLFAFSNSAILLDGEKALGVCLARTDANHTHIRLAAFALASEPSDTPEADQAIAALLANVLAKSSLTEISLEHTHDTSPSEHPKPGALVRILATYPHSKILVECRYERSL